MNIAIITGASSGLGTEYVNAVAAAFPGIDGMWLIARRENALAELAENCSVPCECLSLDLTAEDDIRTLEKKLADVRPAVSVLVNCAGCGYLGDVRDCESDLIARMIDLNVKGLSLVARAVIPYIPEGGHIINVSSIASFCPNPRMTVYSATKAYVSAFSLGLREELRSQRISVTSVCPGPMDTEFLKIGNITGNSKMFSFLPYCDPKAVAEKSVKAAKRDRSTYTPKLFFKFYRLVAKAVIHSLLVKFVKT